ncbi:MAG: hypothetical protein GC160_28435 [Acidobacteria bacterium]|nr:hypothetical protein [Acidobacteriota bacterium]
MIRAALVALLATSASGPLAAQGVVRSAKNPTSAQTIQELSQPATDTPAYVSGGVMMQDGSQVPKETIVELRCGSFGRGTSRVSSKGEFDIDLTGNLEGVQDATQASGRSNDLPGRNQLGMMNLSGCVVRADLPGYQSSEIALGMISVFDNPDVGDLLLSPLEGLTGDVISKTSLEAPKSAAKLYEKAKKESQRPDGKLDKATEWLQEAVGEYPRFAAAWTLLGTLQLGLQQDDAARAAFAKAVEADPQFIDPYGPLVRLTAQAGDMDGTVRLGEKALQLNPHQHEVRFFVCGAHLRAGRNQQTVECSRGMIAVGAADEFPQAYQLLGAAQANSGDFPGAADSFRTFLQRFPNATAADRIRAQLQEWETLGVIERTEAP